MEVCHLFVDDGNVLKSVPKNIFSRTFNYKSKFCTMDEAKELIQEFKEMVNVLNVSHVTAMTVNRKWENQKVSGCGVNRNFGSKSE